MAIGRAFAVALHGIDGTIVEVEADVGNGLPGMHIGGLGDAAVAEARERVRAGAKNSGLAWPGRKIVVSMLPASLRKHGSFFDAAIVLATLAAQRRDNLRAAVGAHYGEAEGDAVQQRLANAVVIGEVGLDGRLRKLRGVLPAVMAAKKAGFPVVVVPEENAREANLIDGIHVLGAGDLAQLWHWAISGNGLTPARSVRFSRGGSAEREEEIQADTPDLADIRGQELAKYGLEVAAAGAHNLFFVGPPGSGKTMLARCLPTILPPLTYRDALALTAIRSITEDLAGMSELPLHPPYVAPHHSATSAALIGGGNTARPGAISRAHAGVLFLDEVTLFKPNVLDNLRTPLETGKISLLRSNTKVEYPARPQLVMAANPCACTAKKPEDCNCTPAIRRRHAAAISGPLRDRIDLNIAVAETNHGGLTPTPASEAETGGSSGAPDSGTSAATQQRVVEARQRAAARWSKHNIAATTNAEVAGTFLRRHAVADEAGMAYLSALWRAGELTQRGVDRTLKVAWTIADLDEIDQPSIDQVARAIELHTSANQVMPA